MANRVWMFFRDSGVYLHDHRTASFLSRFYMKLQVKCLITADQVSKKKVKVFFFTKIDIVAFNLHDRTININIQIFYFYYSVQRPTNAHLCHKLSHCCYMCVDTIVSSSEGSYWPSVYITGPAQQQHKQTNSLYTRPPHRTSREL